MWGRKYGESFLSVVWCDRPDQSEPPTPPTPLTVTDSKARPSPIPVPVRVNSPLYIDPVEPITIECLSQKEDNLLGLDLSFKRPTIWLSCHCLSLLWSPPHQLEDLPFNLLPFIQCEIKWGHPLGPRQERPIMSDHSLMVDIGPVDKSKPMVCIERE